MHGFKPRPRVGGGLRETGREFFDGQAGLIAVNLHALALRLDELNGRLLIGGRVEQPRVGNIEGNAHRVVFIRLIGVIRRGRGGRGRHINRVDSHRRGQRVIHLREIEPGVAGIGRNRRGRGCGRGGELRRGGFGIGGAEHERSSPVSDSACATENAINAMARKTTIRFISDASVRGISKI